MTTTTVQSTAAPRSSLLRTALRGNMVFSEVSGLTSLFAARPIANFLGLESTLPFIIIGILLLSHGAILWWGTSQTEIPRWLAWYAIEGDVVWVLASIAILITDPWSFTVGGKWMIALLADAVAAFAIIQYIGLRRLNR